MGRQRLETSGYYKQNPCGVVMCKSIYRNPEPRRGFPNS